MALFDDRIEIENPGLLPLGLTRLKSMTSRGLLVEIGTGPHDPKRQYILA